MYGSVLPFWLEKSQDLDYGGYFTCLNRDGSVFDTDLQDVPLTVTNADIAVVLHLPGDTDGDGEFDLADVANVLRYLAGGWDVTVDVLNADVNGDGVVNLKDVVLMRRALAGWDVTLV